jgi:hypothetical protein
MAIPAASSDARLILSPDESFSSEFCNDLFAPDKYLYAPSAAIL